MDYWIYIPHAGYDINNVDITYINDSSSDIAKGLARKDSDLDSWSPSDFRQS